MSKSENPLVTFLLLTYCHEQFITESLNSVLSQSYAPLEVIVSDDASPDRTWEIIQRIGRDYKGPHKIIMRQNERNLGINRHFNMLVPLVNGEYVIIGAGDDVSIVDRVKISVGELMSKGKTGLFSDGIMIDEVGNKLGNVMPPNHVEKTWQQMIETGSNGGSGFSLAWHRSVLDLFGLIPVEPLGEDAFIPFRCALLNGLVYVKKPLVKYRVHNTNSSFWRHYELAGNSEDRVAIAKKEISHFVELQKTRRRDIRQAIHIGSISDLRAQKAYSLLDSYISFQLKKHNALSSSLLQTYWELLKIRKEFKNNFKFLQFAYRCLRYYYPRIFSFAHYSLSRFRYIVLRKL